MTDDRLLTNEQIAGFKAYSHGTTIGGRVAELLLGHIAALTEQLAAAERARDEERQETEHWQTRAKEAQGEADHWREQAERNQAQWTEEVARHRDTVKRLAAAEAERDRLRDITEACVRGVALARQQEGER